MHFGSVRQPENMTDSNDILDASSSSEAMILSSSTFDDGIIIASRHFSLLIIFTVFEKMIAALLVRRNFVACLLTVCVS